MYPSLTFSQRQALRNDILSDASLNSLVAANDVVEIARIYNLDAAPDFFVWRTFVPTEEIFDAINWASLTPTDAPDLTTTWGNRSLACQGKQFNLQTLLAGRERINTGRANIRAGLQDALTNIPAGAGGALISAGWPAVKTAITRKASRVERFFATGTGTQAAPGVIVHEGPVSYSEISTILAGDP